MAITESCAPTDPRHYVWWFPGSPVKVRVDLHVIERLQKRLRDAGHGIAEQGLLFGKVLDGATEIFEFQPASNRSVPEMIAELSTEPGKRLLVGYYRTEQGETLRLNADDLFLFKTFFGRPYHVFLMIQPSAFAPANATFFFSRGENKMAEFPFLEFPLDASLLATEERDRISRCRQASGESTTVQHSSPPESYTVRTGRRVLVKIAAGALVAAFLLAAGWLSTPLLQQRSSRVWSAIWKAQPAVQSSPHSYPHIGLQAKRQDRDLAVTWNHESPWILAATSGLISIEDGSVKSQISLNSDQIHGESILYSPISDQVLIQLMVTTPTGGATESLRVIRTEAPPTYSSVVSRPPRDSVEPESARLAPAAKPFTPPPITQPALSLTPLNEPPALDSNLNRSASPVASIAVPQTVAPPRPMPSPATPSAPLREPPRICIQ